jgi:two-component system, chemotaxis family, chemotaxis protein CheY
MLKTIMAVDDSDAIRQRLGRLLGEAGYNVIEAQSEKEALARLAQDRVHLIITDLDMAGAEGIELMRQVRNPSLRKSIPILMLTAESCRREMRARETREPAGCVVKPIRGDKLLALVKSILG